MVNLLKNEKTEYLVDFNYNSEKELNNAGKVNALEAMKRAVNEYIKVKDLKLITIILDDLATDYAVRLSSVNSSKLPFWVCIETNYSQKGFQGQIEYYNPNKRFYKERRGFSHEGYDDFRASYRTTLKEIITNIEKRLKELFGIKFEIIPEFELRPSVYQDTEKEWLIPLLEGYKNHYITIINDLIK